MTTRKVFSDSIIPLPDSQGLAPTGMIVNAISMEDHAEEIMTLHFALSMPSAARETLEELVAKGETISPEELQKKFAPHNDDVDKLEKWLTNNGFKIDEVSADKSSIYATSNVPNIEKALHVSMVKVTKNGVTYTAAKNAPSLPEDVGKNVRAIVGLQPFRQMQKRIRFSPPRNENRTLKTRAAAEFHTNQSNRPPFLTSEILKAYNADTLTSRGKGQTIAILIDSFPFDEDIKMFWELNDIPVDLTRIEKVKVGKHQIPDPTGEETLDVAWSSGIATEAKIRIYATGTLSFVDINRALDRIIEDLPSQPNMRQLSISLGLGETYLPDGETDVEKIKYLKLAAVGVNVFVSSGDAGSNPSPSGHDSSGELQAEYAASDPSVIAVGGTSLFLAADGSVKKETAWPGSGGGSSRTFPRPSWQKGDTIPDGAHRLVPDVSSVADNRTGALLVLNGQTTQPIGGTSWSAPVWAGFCALMNSERAKKDLSPLPYLNPVLYRLKKDNSVFRDVVEGSNGAFTAKAGYDMVTGLGVPNVAKLASQLEVEVPGKVKALA